MRLPSWKCSVRRSLLAWFSCAVLLGAALPSKAVVVLYSANFNSPTFSDGALNNPVPTTDTTTLGQDGWLNTSGGGTNNITVSNSATNGFVSLGAAGGQDVRRAFTSVNSGSVFFGADINVSTATATGDYALHFGVDNSTSLFFARTYFKSSGAGFVLATAVSSGTPTYGTTELNFGQTYHVLVRYDFVPGAANDTGALFIDPTTVDGTGDTPYVAMTTVGTDAALISALSLRQGGAASSAALTVDNFEAFINPVPEPGSMALLGIVCGGAIVRYRRKKVLPTA